MVPRASYLVQIFVPKDPRMATSGPIPTAPSLHALHSDPTDEAEGSFPPGSDFRAVFWSLSIPMML